MRGSKAAAEAAALEGLLSSPSTQECRRIYEASIGCDYDDHSQVAAIDKCTIASINKLQFLSSRNSRPQSDVDSPVLGIEIFSCSRRAGLLARAQAALNRPADSPHFTGASGRDALGAHADFINPGPKERAQQAKQADVHPTRPYALLKITAKPLRSRSHDIAVLPKSGAAAMEDFVPPLDEGDGSNLSPTQENDPAVYIRFQQKQGSLPTDSQSSSEAHAAALHAPAISNGSAPSAQDTGITYAVNDTGHLTLDYQPPPSSPLQDSFDDEEIGDVSSGRLRPQLFAGGLLQPQTPAHARLVLGHPGSVMRPSQMFAETQPSPGSKERHLLLPSSSRPTPNVFNQYQSPKQLTSSPLARRIGKIQSEGGDYVGISSSPEPLQSEGVGSKNISRHQPRSDRMNVLTNARSESPVAPNSTYQKFSEPFTVYTTRKESQERRRQHANEFDDVDLSSDDGFSDDEAEKNRRAKRRKEEAARELAVVRTPRPGSAEKDFVEVPSTNTGRRRSLAEDYEAQCSGLDARDTQPDTTILDSQSAPAGVIDSVIDESNSARNNDGLRRSDLLTAHEHGQSQEDSSLSVKSADDQNSEQLPALERNGESEVTESDRESSRSPLGQYTTSQVPSNIAQLRTPTLKPRLPYVDGDTIIPETSPSEPHLQRYGDIVSQTPPVVSTEEVDDAFNPLTQDTEFNNLIHSPSPRRMRVFREVQPTLETNGSEVEPHVGAVEPSKGAEPPYVNLDPSTTKDHKDGVAMSVAAKDTASNDTSEYVTAPTGMTLESISPTQTRPNLTPDCVDAPFIAPNLEGNVEGLQLDPVSVPSLSSAVSKPEVKKAIPAVDMAEVLPGFTPSLLQQLPTHGEHIEHTLAIDASHEVRRPESTGSPPHKRQRLTPHTTKKAARKSEPSFGKSAAIAPVTLAGEPSEILPNRLRSATQLRGSSRALRRVLEESGTAPNMPVPGQETPTLNAQVLTRSSRRSSTNPSEKAQSIEPDADVTPTLSTRRRTMSSQPAETGLFDGMAFSITYSATRENEKQRVLGLIKKNGGRILEKGFDELFDASALQASSMTRSNEAGSMSNGSSLILTVAAREIGFACLIADDHSRRVKFMQALALGLPCISGRWIEHSVARKEILNWDQYHLAAGESTFLGGAIRSRNLELYSASTTNFANRFELRPKLLMGKSILIITGRGRVEERRKPYFFLTQALGARRVKRVADNQAARRFLIEAEANGEEWNWVYVDDNEREAEKAIFGAGNAPPKKRKRGFEVPDEGENTAPPPPKKVRIVDDEYVIQSLIMGKFLEEE